MYQLQTARRGLGALWGRMLAAACQQQLVQPSHSGSGLCRLSRPLCKLTKPFTDTLSGPLPHPQGIGTSGVQGRWVSKEWRFIPRALVLFRGRWHTNDHLGERVTQPMNHFQWLPWANMTCVCTNMHGSMGALVGSCTSVETGHLRCF